MFSKETADRISKWLLLALTLVATATAQTRGQVQPSLTVKVVDPDGAALAAVSVSVKANGGSETRLQTNERGEALFPELRPGRCEIRIEVEGFESQQRELQLKDGANRLDVQMRLGRIQEAMVVTQDNREKLVDPRGDSFTTVLTQEQIALMPDDPEEFENVLRQMAGPGAVINVNGFRGGKLPPKSQIREIRFKLNPYAAENHDSGFAGVDVFTKPGANAWHGSFDSAFRNTALDARSPFAPSRGVDEYRRFGMTLNGPLWKNHTSLFLSANAALQTDSKTVVAALPSGEFSSLVARPSHAFDFDGRVEHSLTSSHTLAIQYQRSGIRQSNLGVGDYDLPDRAYSLKRVSNIFRFSDTGMLTKRLVNEFRFQASLQQVQKEPVNDAPAVIVLNAFNSGGAQVESRRQSRLFELSDNVDFAFGRNSMRMGFRFERGDYDSAERQNFGGTFTFSSLSAFQNGRPTTFTERRGDPAIQFGQYDIGWYWQDDVRLRKNLSLSAGFRHEMQSHVDRQANFAPRLGLAWSPMENTTVRVGAGLFYDWFAPEIFEQTVRVDGRRQSDIVVLNPSYPNAFEQGSGLLLPPSRIQRYPGLRMPYIAQESVAVERLLKNTFQLRVSYLHQHGTHLLRGRDINAPAPGTGSRPDSQAGNIIQVEPSASSRVDLLSASVNSRFTGRFYWLANYTLSRTINDADGPLSLPASNFDFRAERGPALTDARHRVFGMASVGLIRGMRLSSIAYANSGLPYNITTGFDNNGDSVTNDRPKGIGRNTARGASQWDLATRLSWGFGFGRPSDEGSGTAVKVVKGGSDALGALSGGQANKRIRVELYAQVYNLFNHSNLINYSGVETSPFFGRPTATLPARRIETGMRISF